MKKSYLALLAGVMLGIVVVTPSKAQDRSLASTTGVSSGALEFAVTYDAARNGGTPNFWMQGGSVQVEGRFWRGLGAVADVSGLHTANMHGSGVGLDLVTATFGARYTVPLRALLPSAAAESRFALYGQGLAGMANGLDSVFPQSGSASSSASGLAFQVGSGFNYALSRRVAIRALEADWLRTTLPNNSGNVQNNLRLGAGIVWTLIR